MDPGVLESQRWTAIVAEASVETSHKPLSAVGLPAPLLGKMLNPQEIIAPIKGWVEGTYHAKRDPGRMIITPLPEAAGVFRWTRLGETDLQDRPRRLEVPLPDLDNMGIDTLIYFQEKSWGVQIPWNEGLRAEINKGYMAQTYHVDPKNPERGAGRIPVLTVPTLLSDANKIAWMRAYLGCAYRCVVTKDPRRAMTPPRRVVTQTREEFPSGDALKNSCRRVSKNGSKRPSSWLGPAKRRAT